MGVKGPTSLATDVTDLNLMVRGTGTGGQVSSVCSQVEAPRTVDQVSAVIGFQFTVQSRFRDTRDLGETIESGPLCITDLLKNQSVAY